MASQDAPDPALAHDDLGPRLVVIIWFWMILSSVILFLRVYCKLIRRRSSLWWDDHLLILGWIVLLADCSITTYLVSLGYGKRSWDFPMENLAQAVPLLLIRATLIITAVAWTKTSFAITLLRLVVGWRRYATWFIAVTINLALGLSGLLPWLRCTPLHSNWDIAVVGTCWSNDVIFDVHVFSGAYSAAMDFALALLGGSLIWGLTMERKEKIGVAAAMSMGILAGVAGVIKTAMLPNLFTADMYDSVQLMYWDVGEAAVTIIASSIPVLRVLVHDMVSRSPQTPNEGLRSLQSRFRRMQNRAHGGDGGDGESGDDGDNDAYEMRSTRAVGPMDSHDDQHAILSCKPD